MSGKLDVFMPLIIGDFVKHIARFRDGDVGSYILLIIDYWVVGPPPDDDAILATIARCDAATWTRRRELLTPLCFQVVDGVWRHKRIDKELAKAAGRSRKARGAANARHGNRDDDARSMLGASPEQRRPVIDVDEVRTQMEQAREAAGDALASMATHPGIASVASLRALLSGENPCDWTEDILPAVMSAAAWHRNQGGPGSMTSWKTAARIAAENRDRRLAGPAKTGNGHGRTTRAHNEERQQNLARALGAPGIRTDFGGE